MDSGVKEKKKTKHVIKKLTRKNKKKDGFENLPYLEDIEKTREKKQKKLLNKLELIVIVIFSIIMLILLCNRTFFRSNYKNSKVNIDLPLLMFFKSDKDNKIELKTLRKSQYLKDYFDNQLKYMTKYNCGGYDFYYNDKDFFAIYDIKIEKDFIMKTVTIEYAAGDANCLCNVGVTGKRAEEKCLK